MLCEMLSVSSRFWTRVAVSISYDDNYYTTGTSTTWLMNILPVISCSCWKYVYISCFDYKINVVTVYLKMCAWKRESQFLTLSKIIDNGEIFSEYWIHGFEKCRWNRNKERENGHFKVCIWIDSVKKNFEFFTYWTTLVHKSRLKFRIRRLNLPCFAPNQIVVSALIRE